MTIEIWSDIACPFCYIGKRRFERALAQFEKRSEVQIVWRSFQLDPDLATDPNASAIESLARRKGWTLEQTRQIQAQVAQMAAGEGLDYHFENQVLANTFDAHRLLHLAGQHGKQGEAQERLFAAHFCEGKNIADPVFLTETAANIGLDPAAAQQSLASDAFAEAVRSDIQLARQFGINGVPFFVFDRQYAVSGTQDSSAFLSALQQAAGG